MKNLLIVDDSAETRRLYKLFLEYHFHFIAEASSGREAMTLLKNMKVDVILSDLEMPDGDGHWLLNEVKSTAKEIVVIIISGDVTADESKLIEKGALAFFPKPVNFSSLIKTLKTLYP